MKHIPPSGAHVGWRIDPGGTACQTAGMQKKPAKNGTRPRPPVARVGDIPGWGEIGHVVIPKAAYESRRNRRYRDSTDPQKVLKTLLVTLWHGVGRVERTSVFPGACTARALTDAMRTWAPTYDDRESILRMTWRSYLEQLTQAQRRRWRDKFTDQLDSWRDWDTASRLAGRVHSVWFRCLADETGCR